MIHDLLVGKSAITPSLNLVWHDGLFYPGLSFSLYPKSARQTWTLPYLSTAPRKRLTYTNCEGCFVSFGRAV